MFYIWRSSIGRFTIWPGEGRWFLSLGDAVAGKYDSPESAAEDVFMQETGCLVWDERDPRLALAECPCELSEWEHHPTPVLSAQ